MNKKFLSAILGVTLLFSSVATLTSCGSSDKNNNENQQSSNTASDNAVGDEILGTVESEGLAYVLSKDESYYLVSGMGECKDTRVVIPATYNSRPVLGIAEGNSQAGAGAFEGCQTLESIVIPDGATTIGAAAFASCRNLKRVSMPNSITFIEATAFNGCAALSYNEFENAKYLGNKENPYAVLISAKNKTVTSSTVHTNTTMIMSKAFTGCTALTSVTFQNAENWSVNETVLLKTDLENTATAASYLTGNYCARIWLRNAL